ncbi:MAG: TIGR02186 family protein [Acetobacteraceae bacterium]|nr:TIGR02186 family protein [Acetobacteraceae bacterium]
MTRTATGLALLFGALLAAAAMVPLPLRAQPAPPPARPAAPAAPGQAAPAAPALAVPALVAELSQRRVEITTGFTGADILVFGSTERLIGENSDEVLVVASGPPQPMVVRRKVKILGFWVNGPSATFPQVPGFYAISGTRPAWQMLPEDVRQSGRLGLDALPLRALGAQGPAFRAALLELKKNAGLWVEDTVPVEVSGGRLFHVRLPLPATVTPGAYRVEVLLVRDRRIVARQGLDFEVVRVGAAAEISTIASTEPMLYGLVCIALAAFAGWFGSVVFRRS